MMQGASVLRRVITAGLILTAAWLALPAAATAQESAAPAWPEARPEDVASIDALLRASYETLNRAPGEDFDWERYRSLRLPGAIVLPNAEQSGGSFAPRTVDEHVSRIERAYAESGFIGSDRDRGFAEEEIHRVVRRYGDVAHVESTYTKRPYDAREVAGRGVNFYTLVFDGERWWITAAAWDEENGAGPIPDDYLP